MRAAPERGINPAGRESDCRARPLPAPGGFALRAIIVNSKDRTIIETEIDGSLKTLQQIVGGLIEAVYQGLDDNHHCYVNEEGLLDDPQYFFMFTDGQQPLAGQGVILSSTDEGGEAPCTLSTDWVKQCVTFMDLEAARQWAREH